MTLVAQPWKKRGSKYQCKICSVFSIFIWDWEAFGNKEVFDKPIFHCIVSTAMAQNAFSSLDFAYALAKANIMSKYVLDMNSYLSSMVIFSCKNCSKRMHKSRLHIIYKSKVMLSLFLVSHFSFSLLQRIKDSQCSPFPF